MKSIENCYPSALEDYWRSKEDIRIMHWSIFVLLMGAVAGTRAQLADSARPPPQPRCPKGEVWNACGPSCPPSCANNTCQMCTMQCVSGCFCAGDTVRAPDGSCVKPKNCPRPTCGRNEVFEKCPPTCPRTEECKNLWSKKPCKPIDCCHPSCRCKPGYYRNKQKACISARECRK